MNHSIIRITKELNEFQHNSDLAIAVGYKDSNVRHVKALVMGPHETPYEFGFFEFSIHFPHDYPSTSPNVSCLTTNSGQCRFNPNIYSSGKVCLSILGTWRGEPGEQWSSAQGLESVLLSIQSLLGANPYTNEPGYEEAKSQEDKDMQQHYIDKIQHETIRISVIQRLEEYLGLRASLTGTATYAAAEDIDPAIAPFEPFVDLCKRRFLWYFDSYLDTIQKGKKLIKDGKAFVGMPFESMVSLESNGMKGVFDYGSLETRLHAVKAAIDKETERWAAKGLLELKNDSCVAANLQHQFKQVTAQLQYGSSPMDVTLEENNPFVWFVTYFGRPMTNLDGGVFRLRMSFSPSFPSEAPRVKLETKIFHECVTSDGTLCYVPNLSKIEDVRSHIDAMIKALENDEPTYDPRKIVNPEATRLFWGKKPEDKKQYNRRLRRSVQQMMEESAE